MEYEDINMRCRKCLVAYANGVFALTLPNTILTENVATAGKSGKEGIQKISKTWAVCCTLQVLRVLIQNIDTLDFFFFQFTLAN